MKAADGRALDRRRSRRDPGGRGEPCEAQCSPRPLRPRGRPRSVHGAGRGGRRRGGPGVLGLRSGARPQGRPQASQPAHGHHRTGSRPTPARGPGPRQARPSQRRGGLRRRRPRGAGLRRDGVHRGADPRRVDPIRAGLGGGRHPKVAGGPRGIRAGGTRACGSPRGRARASRLQARQRDDRRRRPRPRHGLRARAHRSGADGRARARGHRDRLAHAVGRDAGHAGVHVSGAVRPRAHGPAQRPVQLLHHPVGSALRRAPVRGRDGGRARGDDHEGLHPGAVSQHRRPELASRRDRAGARHRPRGALRVDGRAARRPRVRSRSAAPTDCAALGPGGRPRGGRLGCRHPVGRGRPARRRHRGAGDRARHPAGGARGAAQSPARAPGDHPRGHDARGRGAAARGPGRRRVRRALARRAPRGGRGP